MATKVNRQNISEVLLEYQLSQIGKTVKDALETLNWREVWDYSKEKEDKFKQYAIPLIKKVFKCSKGKAISTLDWYILHFGLKAT